MKRENQNREKNARFQTPSRRTINGFIANVLFACVMDLFFSVYECQKTTDKCVVGMQLFVVFFFFLNQFICWWSVYASMIWSGGRGDGPNAGSLCIVVVYEMWTQHTTYTQKLAMLARTMKRCIVWIEAREFNRIEKRSGITFGLCSSMQWLCCRRCRRCRFYFLLLWFPLTKEFFFLSFFHKTFAKHHHTNQIEIMECVHCVATATVSMLSQISLIWNEL